MKSSLILDRNQVDFTLEALSEKGLVIFEKMVPDPVLAQWNQFFNQKYEQGQFHPAAVGKDQAKSAQQQIRSDEIYWLQEEPEFDYFWELCSQLEFIFNSELFLGIKSKEFHLASYQPGRHYQKHFDRHKNSNHRQITLVCYLNQTWLPSWGGELNIYSPDNNDKPLQKVSPHPGSLVLFRSELFPHEVLPATQERRSLTGWFRSDDNISLR